MDAELEKLLDEVRKRVEVLEGENPITNNQDAIRLAERAGILYRYAQNGSVWELRWTIEHPVFMVPGHALGETICREIIRTRPPRLLESGKSQEEVAPTPKSAVKAKRTSKKSSGG